MIANLSELCSVTPNTDGNCGNFGNRISEPTLLLSLQHKEEFPFTITGTGTTGTLTEYLLPVPAVPVTNNNNGNRESEKNCLIKHAVTSKVPVVPAAPVINIIETVEMPLVPNTCQARKVGGRICGHALKTGPTGKKYCGDPGCQIPAERQISGARIK